MRHDDSNQPLSRLGEAPRTLGIAVTAIPADFVRVVWLVRCARLFLRLAAVSGRGGRRPGSTTSSERLGVVVVVDAIAVLGAYPMQVPHLGRRVGQSRIVRDIAFRLLMFLRTRRRHCPPCSRPAKSFRPPFFLLYPRSVYFFSSKNRTAQ